LAFEESGLLIPDCAKGNISIDCCHFAVENQQMNFPLRLVARILVVVVAISSTSFAGEKIKPKKTERYTTKRYTTTQYTTRYRRVYSSEDVPADVVIARPAWFAETVVGAGLFVAALPFALLSNSVDETAHALVIKPGRATFRRVPGDFSTIE